MAYLHFYLNTTCFCLVIKYYNGKKIYKTTTTNTTNTTILSQALYTFQPTVYIVTQFLTYVNVTHLVHREYSTISAMCYQKDTDSTKG